MKKYPFNVCLLKITIFYETYVSFDVGKHLINVKTKISLNFSGLFRKPYLYIASKELYGRITYVKPLTAIKVHMFRESHKNLLLTTVHKVKEGGDFEKYCGLLRIYEL